MEEKICKRVAQISVLCRISGNVNADWGVGQRITLKKLQTAEGEVKPFVSARCIKHSIRRALRERGHPIDPFQVKEVRGERPRSFDSGDPVNYVDNDLFGFMVAAEREEHASRRQGPIAMSYLRALRSTPVIAELGLRAPREAGQPPLPFEVEVAEFVGRLDCLIYDYVGIYEGTERVATKEGKQKGKKQSKAKFAKRGEAFIDEDKRRKRLYDFLDIFLTPSYVLPRRSTSLTIPEYIAALVLLSESGPKPVYQYLNYKPTSTGDGIVLDSKLLKKLKERAEKWRGVRIFLIDYVGLAEEGGVKELQFEALSPEEAVREIAEFILQEAA